MSRSSRPSTYSGIWGPGMLVTSRLNSRVEKFSRVAWASTVGGEKLTAGERLGPDACLDSLSPSIAARTTLQPGHRVLDIDRQRAAHDRELVAEVALLLVGADETGTSARSSSPSVRVPRERSHFSSPPETTVSTTSLTVPPSASLTTL